jgi:hypothetical protein
MGLFHMHSLSFQCSTVLFDESLVTFQHVQGEREVAGTLSEVAGT